MKIHTIIKEHWTQLRQMTYDLLDVLEVNDLGLKLNFERSQSIGYQFWCMLGAQESWISLIESGKWQGFSCSVTSLEDDKAIENIRRQMQLADDKLLLTLATVDLAQEFDDGRTSLSNYLTLVEHESHHQGQLINFIYAHDLPIPDSWEAKWNLKRENVQE
jgi:uncharacterized damage-inducible protein DinB